MIHRVVKSVSICLFVCFFFYRKETVSLICHSTEGFRPGNVNKGTFPVEVVFKLLNQLETNPLTPESEPNIKANKGNSRQLKNLLIFKQILVVSSLRYI